MGASNLGVSVSRTGALLIRLLLRAGLMRDQTQLLSLRELRYDAMPHALILPGEAYRKEARKAAGWQIDQTAGGPARRRSAGSRNCPRICPLMSHVRHASRAVPRPVLQTRALQQSRYRSRDAS